MGDVAVVYSGPETSTVQHDDQPVCPQAQSVGADGPGLSTGIIQIHSHDGCVDVIKRFSRTPGLHIPVPVEKAGAT